MYVRDEIQTLLDKLKHFQKVLVKLAKDNSDAILPGFTHLQHAQPVLFSHHILAYVEMFSRDYDRLKDCLKRVNVMPLGSGALAGSTLPINREITAKILNFPEISRNSMDAVADRDYMCELLSAFAVFAMHISRLSEDMILWCSQEFDFIVLSDAFTTGSSLMPQKKNPDICEISRGKTARIYGSLTALLTMCKGLPLTYNRDLQEDKEPLFDAIDTVNRILNIYPPMMEEMKLNKDKMLSAATDPLLMATDLAEELVKLGVPFRTAHHRVGALVKWCEDNKTPLNEVTLEQMLEVIPEATDSCLNIYSPKISVAKRDVIGGTAPVQVLKQIEFWENELS
jgi:argininosuccinate lyase